jgi:type IV secretory pathway TraG/TraD family ATPase VirD4
MSASRQQPVHPRGHAGGYPLAPWIILGASGAATGASWLAWVAGRLLAWATGTPQTGPPFGQDFVGGMLRGSWDTLWPGLSPAAVGVVWTALVAAVLVGGCCGWAWWRARRPRAGDPLPSLAQESDLAGLRAAAVAQRAKRLRPSLATARTRRLPAAQIGVPVGTLVTTGRRRRTVLYAGWEDVLLAVMAPRAGKTTALAVPPILQAPGPVIATSNKADLWAATTGARARAGTVWLFDPQHITHTPQAFWWNPLAAVTSVEEASRLADHFVQEIRTPGVGDVFWPLAAADLLTCLFLAAAHCGGTLADVQAWLADATSREPVTLLRTAGFPQAARAMLGRQNGAPETRDGVYETARTAARCLADPAIMAWVTPPADATLPAFDTRTFPTTADTLYLLSKEGAGAAAPLVAALTDQSFRSATAHAEAAGGRIDPPLLAVLDEAANICKIADLPQLYSHLGSRGVVPITIVQNYAQGAGVWGERGMAALWSASTLKLIGAGLDDARHAEDVSRLLGEHDVAVASTTRDPAGYASWSTSVQRRRIMDPGQVRALPRGQALLLATGAKPALVELRPWYTGDRAQATSAQLATAIDTITRHAKAELHQDLP